MTRLAYAAIGAVMTLAATVGVTVVADPASASVPDTCHAYGYYNGREVDVDNYNNGGGAYVYALLCWYNGNLPGYYNTQVWWTVWDTDANSAGATIRMEWEGTDTATHYDVPPEEGRAWVEGRQASGTWKKNNIRLLYVRACLTNHNSEAHHCGAKG